MAALALVLMTWTGTAQALQPVSLGTDADRIELTPHGEIFEGRGDYFQIETAPGLDGVPGRMSVRAQTPGTSPVWFAFALTNPTDRLIERWLTAERYTFIGSGIIWPDLDSRRIEIVTPSVGYLPERVRSERADIFKVTLEPGQTITYVVELASTRVPRILVWKPLEYEVKARERQFSNGILLGITGVLGIFLTAVFAANHKAIFPSAALFAWCVLGYLAADFGFFHKLFNLRADDNAVYRAATESAVAASLVIFLTVFLRLGSWNSFFRMLAGVWIVAQLALVGIAVVDPNLAATFARVSFASTGVLGAVLILYLALRGQDRALSLIPTWILYLVFVFAGAVTLTGRLQGEAVVFGLVAGMVLIVVLIGFTVTQFAFRAQEPILSGEGGGQLGAMAIEGAGAATWEWHGRRNEIKVGGSVEASLGLSSGELSTKVEDFIRHVHPADQDKLRLMLASLKEKGRGVLALDLRLRHADNSYRWFALDAASIEGGDARSARCIGLLRDITEQKRASERMMQDAVLDSLTGLPSRELFLDRLGVAMAFAHDKAGPRPTVLFVDLDKFKSVNSSFGLVVGDSLLLTVARRMSKHIKSEDTLARVSGDQFAILVLSEQDPHELAQLAERVRRSIRAPIKIVGQDIVVTGSIGIAILGDASDGPHALLKDAEIAMHRAKHDGTDRIEIFRPEMRAKVDDRVPMASELRAAIEKRQLKVVYQPIVYLPTEELSGFEALVRWDHPRLGRLSPQQFIPVAEESDLIVELGNYVLQRAVEEAVRWQSELPRADRPLFVSVNVSSRQLFRPDLIQSVRQVLGRNLLPKGCLRLEITESLVMANPEQASEVLDWLKSAGTELALDDFGTGYSSLAYLQRFPFDTIKIDRELVEGCGRGSENAVIVRSIVAMARELGRKVVAEGIEEEEDALFLRGIGCEFAQGFHFGEPIADRDVINMLRMIRKTERKLQRRGFFRAKPGAAAGKDRPKGASGQRKTKSNRPAEAKSVEANGASANAADARMAEAGVSEIRPDDGAAANPRSGEKVPSGQNGAHPPAPQSSPGPTIPPTAPPVAKPAPALSGMSIRPRRGPAPSADQVAEGWRGPAAEPAPGPRPVAPPPSGGQEYGWPGSAVAQNGLGASAGPAVPGPVASDPAAYAVGDANGAGRHPSGPDPRRPAVVPPSAVVLPISGHSPYRPDVAPPPAHAAGWNGAAPGAPPPLPGGNGPSSPVHDPTEILRRIDRLPEALPEQAPSNKAPERSADRLQAAPPPLLPSVASQSNTSATQPLNAIPPIKRPTLLAPVRPSRPPDLSTLPPAIAKSLARLAAAGAEPPKDGE